MDIEINEDFQRALDLFEITSKSVFISGKAGTGKSTLLQYFTDKSTKEIAVLAPTGVSALNVSGETIHSFFGFQPNVNVEDARKKAFRQTKNELYTKLDSLVIDEISMVRADLLDCVDVFLKVARQNFCQPFGGVQMIFFGDLFQLPPVLNKQDQVYFSKYYQSPYFFDAKIFTESGFEMGYLELQKIYRQEDSEFIRLLNSIRTKQVNSSDLEMLNSRFFSFEDQGCIYLTTTNAKASEINDTKISVLNGEARLYECDITGDFEKGRLPTEKSLELKVGAQVMFVNNDSAERWINGTIGKIVDLFEDEVHVELADGEKVIVEPNTWDLYQYYFDKEKECLAQEVVGTFTQIPLKLAWAITIHKSQGKTFDKVIIDLGWGSFAHGQTYVALSRCTSLDGIFLKRPVKFSDIKMDARVFDFVKRFKIDRKKRQIV